MRIIKAENYNDMSLKAASVIGSHININPDVFLGLATGSTMVEIYQILASWCKSGDLDFSHVKTANLDEYVGLSADHPQSYHYYMDTNLFSKININPSNVNIQDGMAKDPEVECRRYDEMIDSFGRIDLQLLGLGLNGHIGFNEPSDHFKTGTHCIDLSEETINSNSRFFDNREEVPKQALTMGIKSIIQAKQVLLCVSGSQKAGTLKEVLTGSVCPKVPGSILQLHPDLIVIADKEALAEM